MTIRKRLILSNLLMILLPAVMALAASVVIGDIFENRMDGLEEIFEEGHLDIGDFEDLKTSLLALAGGIAVIFIGAVILISVILTGIISRSIIRPLEELREGARRIGNGDLDAEIAYRRNNEIGEVCRDFNDMRIRLKQSVEERIRYDQYRREMISGISHDLRTPLTSIRGYVEGLRDGIADTDEKRERYYAAIQRRTSDLESLVETLSLFSRLENSSFHYNLQRTGLGTYISSLIDDYMSGAERDRINILYKAQSPEPVAMIDPREMKRLFVNLFENSLRYSQKDLVTVSVDVRSDGQSALITVSDDGPGVPEDELERIFDSFYRGDKARSNAGEGSGLGLSIVKSIAEGHGGSVRACNRDGLNIEIELPAVR